MMKYYNYVSWWVLLYMILPCFISFADQPIDEISGKFENSSIYQQTKELIQTRRGYYKNLLTEGHGTFEDTIQYENKLINLIRADFIETKVDWLKESEKKLDLTALCSIAAEIQCPTPIVLFPELFDYSIFGYEKYYGKHKVEDRLEDYPFLYLAVQCRQKSIPLLDGLILDKKQRSELRLKAIAILMKIDSEEASKLALAILNDLPPEMSSILSAYLKNPLVEPWDMMARFSRRSQTISERKSQE